MIIAERKPFEQIKEMLAPYQRICVLGCGTCVTVCMAGGQKEAEELAALIRIQRKQDRQEATVEAFTIERQCEFEFIDQVLERLKGYDAILSLACGIGVQTPWNMRQPKGHAWPEHQVHGLSVAQGVWWNAASGCGDCVSASDQGICPITRCAKSLLNGPSRRFCGRKVRSARR